MRLPPFLQALGAGSLLVLAACSGGGGGSSNEPSPPVPAVNQAPSANAGPDQSVNEKTEVSLIGAGTDADGHITDYAWQQIDGTPVVLSGTNTATTQFTAPETTTTVTLNFRLTVTDNAGATASDTVQVRVEPLNEAPQAHAGDDLSVAETTLVSLSGSGMDNDGHVVSYLWQQIGGMEVALQDSEKASASFTAPITVAPLTLQFLLTVIDNEGASAHDEVTVTVYPVNELPVADAGADITVDEQALVNLSGSGNDNDGQIVSYQWSAQGNPTLVIQNATQANASVQTPTTTDVLQYTIQLTVTDNEGGTHTDTIRLTVNPVNEHPVANLGEDQRVRANRPVSLSGAASYDPDGSIVDYQLVQIVGPSADISGEISSNASVVPPAVDDVTELVFELTVIDNEGAQAKDTLSLTVYPNRELNDSGYLKCGDNTNEGLNCPVPTHVGQDAERGRDAKFLAGTLTKVGAGIAGFDFTKIDANGNPLPANATSWACVRDNHTGLMWEAKTDDDGLQDKDHTYSWLNTDFSTNGGNLGGQDRGVCTGSMCDTQNYTNAVNALNGGNGLCGFSDWRVPFSYELLSLVSFSRSAATGFLDPDYFPYSQGSWWAAETYIDANNHAHLMQTGPELNLTSRVKTDPSKVRLVRTVRE